MNDLFANRQEAGRFLAEEIKNSVVDLSDVLVLGLPRGGVVVAYEVAIHIDAELDIYVVRKLGTPMEPEFAMGAIAEDGLVYLNDAVVNYMSISKKSIDDIASKELDELNRRVWTYRNGRGFPRITARTVIVVDDGLATGASMKVALRAIKRKAPFKLIVAVPVGSPSTCMELQSEADKIICLKKPEPFLAVGTWYRHFEQTEDKEVKDLLQKAHERVKK
jgi:predicted phosphoribosyltransferase